MFVRNYRVKGADVNDFMVMQNFAYLSYSSKIIEAYLLENGFSPMKLNNLQIGWQKNNDQLRNKHHLMFAQDFSVRLNFESSLHQEAISTFVDFYNSEGALVATVITQLQWMNYSDWKFISTPKNMKHLFERNFRKAV
jgi:acyl-CoA thioesterase FadM